MSSILQKYRENFVQFINEKNETYVLNSNREHAHILIEELVRSAKKSIRIQCTNFSSDVYTSKIVNALKEKSSEGVQVYIAVRTPEREAIVTEMFKDSGIKPCFGKDSFENDYCVVDGERVRVELDSDKREAIAYAFNQSLGGALYRIFENQVLCCTQ